MRRALVLASLLCLGLSTEAAGQGPDAKTEPWNDAKLKIGPFFIAPTFDISRVGVDRNVFRDPAFPRRDLTATVAVSSIFGAHFKGFSVMLTQDNRYLWFRRYTSERSIDGSLKMVIQLRTAPIRPWITWEKANSHERVGYEIDARAGRETPAFDFGSDFNFGDRTGATVGFNHRAIQYAEGEAFDGTTLRDTMDRKSTNAHVGGYWKYSDSTNIVGAVDYSNSIFTYDPKRDADTLAYTAGFATSGDAVVTGNLSGGYKVQHHRDRTMPDFRGVVLNAGVTTVAWDRVKLSLVGDRDVDYSYDDRFAFYIQEGTGFTAVGRLSTRLDLIASEKAEWLRYDNLVDGSAIKRVDRTLTTGVGFLYTMGGGGSHFGLTLEHMQRISPLAKRNFQSNRILTDLKFLF